MWIACCEPPQVGTEELHLIVDSTGLKLRGAGESLFEKQGTAKRRSWRKLHIGIEADSGEIVAFDLTEKDVDDALHVAPLLDQLTQDPASFMGDGAYDRAAKYNTILARNPSARLIVPPCKGLCLDRQQPSRQPKGASPDTSPARSIGSAALASPY